MSTPTGPSTPPGSTGHGASAADAIAAALADRETLMRSLEERRAQVFSLLATQKQEAIDTLQRARDMLDQARPGPPPAAATPLPTLSRMSTTEARRERLRRRLVEALATLPGLPVAEGEAEQGRRDQAAAEIADAIVELIADEITRRLGR